MPNLSRLFPVLLATILAGCATTPPGEDPLASSVRVCLSENARFPDAWGCIQARYAVGQISGEEPRLKAFLKLGDDLAQQVAAGKLSNSKARERLSAGLPKDVEE